LLIIESFFAMARLILLFVIFFLHVHQYVSRNDLLARDLETVFHHHHQTHHHEHQNKESETVLIEEYNNVQAEKGIVMCSGGHHLYDLIRTIYMLRMVWNTTVPITVMHCSELNQDFIDIIRGMNNTTPGSGGEIHIHDVCLDPEKDLGMQRNFAHQRLRKYFCKVAAVIESPYDHTMLVDLDLVFFKSPESLFSSQTYQENGLLFFRDRIFTYQPYENNNKEPTGVVASMTADFKMGDILFNASYVQSEFAKNGISLFWKTLKPYWKEGEAFPLGMGQFEDSSIVLVDRTRHPKFLSMLKILLPGFEATIGDQDIYWIAATIVQEPFSFSPYLAGQYGDCSGFMIHYDPDDVYSNHPDDPSVLYMNAEYLVEDSSKRNAGIGHFLQEVMTKAIRVTTRMKQPPHNNCFLHHFRIKNCTCGDYECQPVPSVVQKHLLLNQWLMYSLKMPRGEHEHLRHHHHADNNSSNYQRLAQELDGKQCLPIFIQCIPLLNEIISDSRFFSPSRDCTVMGCPEFPFGLEEPDLMKWRPSVGILCDPMVFGYHASLPLPVQQLLHNYAREYRVPRNGINSPEFKPTNQLIQCQGRRSLYLLQEHDRKFHAFHNWETFVKMGFDTSEVMVLPFHKCETLEIGEPLPIKHKKL
jgi:hypothetical protein